MSCGTVQWSALVCYGLWHRAVKCFSVLLAMAPCSEVLYCVTGNGTVQWSALVCYWLWHRAVNCLLSPRSVEPCASLFILTQFGCCWCPYGTSSSHRLSANPPSAALTGHSPNNLPTKHTHFLLLLTHTHTHTHKHNNYTQSPYKRGQNVSPEVTMNTVHYTM
jgi:hypothetical protein